MKKINIKLLKFFSVIYLIGSSPALLAAVFHSIDTTAPLKCTFSSIHHNRIVADQSKIIKVVSSDAGLSINMEPESGQVFIYSLYPHPKDTVISVVTKGGHVQDIEISFEERSTEVVILLEPSLCEEEIEPPTRLEELANLDELIGQILAGETPQGYESCTIDRIRSKLKSGLFIESVSLFRNPCENIYVYEIINVSNCIKEITEKELEGQESQWVHLKCGFIKPKSKTIAIISYPRTIP